MKFKKIKQKFFPFFLLVFFICFCAIINVELFAYLNSASRINSLSYIQNESDSFRAQLLSVKSLESLKQLEKSSRLSFSELLAVLMLEQDFNLELFQVQKGTEEDTAEELERVKKYKKKEFEILKKSYEMIWADLKYFPVPSSKNNPDAVISFTDTWMSERTYGGKRSHEGTDLMAGINERGYYPVLSMTDGVVENIGWLEKGGYRIGIRAPLGGYFYYAHLDSYAPGIKEGDTVTAGSLIGYMGDSGYGPEGTTGQFDVHLHLGIYIKTENNTELSVNPFWPLKYIEDKKLEYSY